ncbi:hypothetical protein [Rufibacter latericius]|uniref:Uncharacterized protein n=1 Tax=Rufibacter latericius TaxID=2487040 RepID=A0A3M9MFZ7_9BACT|nr:hypothetical protein [Rufibacter latericius]RNI24087.1 hypothetical protein EFB08_17080 [Rufibacter latericius]
MINGHEIVLYTKEGFIVRVESTELQEKFLASSQYRIEGDCPLEKMTAFIEEVMDCQVPEQSWAGLRYVLEVLGHPEHLLSA